MHSQLVGESHPILISPYIQNILDQPKTLRQALAQFPEDYLNSTIVQMYQSGDIERIVIAGLGASLNSLYPAYVRLTTLPVPIVYINTAELIYCALGQINSHTLLCIASQSGRSAETLNLLTQLQGEHKPACLLALTNDLGSPLGTRADITIDINAGDEYSVATKTYTNTLVFATLFAHQILGNEISSLVADFSDASNVMEGYLKNWQTHVELIEEKIGEFDFAVIVGRGTSMAGTWNGALIQKEAARVPVEGYHAAQFRHGPLEMVDKGLLMLTLGGNTVNAELNHKLALDVIERGGRALWISANPSSVIPSFVYPEVADVAVPLFEVLFFQLFSLAMAVRKKITAGEFINIGKIVESE